MAVNTKPMSFSMALRKRDPSHSLSFPEERKTTVVTAMAIKMDPTHSSILSGELFEKSITVVMAEGPAMRGIATGTMKGSEPAEEEYHQSRKGDGALPQNNLGPPGGIDVLQRRNEEGDVSQGIGDEDQKDCGGKKTLFHGFIAPSLGRAAPRL
ncbi:MAG: hypothetical protein FD137_503 [Spirochaetes bacterium]|nr:MAG: hypothetical protein FD137_503 [Spirochaetota bacterium]